MGMGLGMGLGMGMGLGTWANHPCFKKVWAQPKWILSIIGLFFGAHIIFLHHSHTFFYTTVTERGAQNRPQITRLNRSRAQGLAHRVGPGG